MEFKPSSIGLPPGETHDALYGDPKRVHKARIQAEGRIGARNIKHAILAPAETVLRWITPETGDTE